MTDWPGDSYAITRDTWARIASYLQTRPGAKTLEFGSGFSTVLFSLLDVEHTAIESDKHTYMRTQRHLEHYGDAARVDLLYCPIRRGWYEWEPTGVYDVILVDGPTGIIGRGGVLPNLQMIADPSALIVVDDVRRPAEMRIARSIVAALEKGIVVFDRAAFIGGRCPTQQSRLSTAGTRGGTQS